MTDFAVIWSFLEANWSWALGLAGAMGVLTTFAASILSKSYKESLALWLMGAEDETTWATRFTALFDAVFGDRHLSLRCFVRSAIASVLAVALIWLLMGWAGAYGLRLGSDLALLEILAYAIAVNVLADYLSLLETRWLLGWLARPRHALVHIAVLAADLLLSATIIWLVLLAFLHSPFYPGEADSFAEIAGVFSPFSVLFYSTFLTSLWSWAFILSSWVLRVFRGLRLGEALDVENKPLAMLGLILGVFTFAGALAGSAVLQKDSAGLTALDRGLCTLFKGEVCLSVAGLTEDTEAELELVLLACEGGLTEECLNRGLASFEVTPEEAHRYWQVACAQGNASGCTNLAYLLEHELGVARDLERAHALYRQSCEANELYACANLGVHLLEGIVVARDLARAEPLLEAGCEADVPGACVNLGKLYVARSKSPEELNAAIQLWEQGCNRSEAGACVNLGVMFERGLGVEKQMGTAADLYEKACEMDDLTACTNLALVYAKGDGRPRDKDRAQELFQLSCDQGVQIACINLALEMMGLGSSQAEGDQ